MSTKTDPKDLARAEAQHEQAKAALRAINRRGFDARAECGLPPEATVEELRAAVKERYAHVHDPARGPRTWAEYQWLICSADREVARTSARVCRLRLEEAQGGGG